MGNIKYGNKASKSIQKGVDAVADAVKITLGPKGQSVMIDKGNDILPIVTKDGVTVAKSIELDDRYQRMGAKLIKDVAEQAEQGSGDGTTTATVLTQAILKEGLKLVAAGYDSNELRMGINLGAMQAVEYIKSISTPIGEGSKMIEQIATISANNNEGIGKLVAEAFDKVGKEGGVSVEEGHSQETEITVVNGMHFDRGMASPYFSTHPERMEANYKDPYIMFVDGKLTTVEDVMPTLEQTTAAGRPLLIIAEDITGQALMTLTLNKTRGGAQVIAVKTPGFGSQRAEILQDMAYQTGGIVCNTEHLDTITGSFLGQADSVTVTQHGTVIVGAKGLEMDIKNRVSELKDKIKLEKSEFNKTNLRNRISKLSGGIAVIHVGGNSEVEIKEKMDRVIDAKEAVISALEEGVVLGGGVALLHAAENISDSKNIVEQMGIELIKKALLIPVKTICHNAGTSGDVVVQAIRKQYIINGGGNFGYDAKKGEYHDMIVVGIIDPAKVTRVALENAASVAGTILTTGCAIKL